MEHSALQTRAADRSLFHGVEAVATYTLIGLLCVAAVTIMAVNPFWLLLALPMIPVAYLGADALSGLFHFLGDTVGSETTPIIGKNFIFPFREHHVDPLAMTRRPFAVTNGANALVLLPFLGLLLWAAPFTSILGFFMAIFGFFLLLFVFCTNQFHKWAHLPHTQRSPLAQWLQATGLILTPVRHERHHAAPFDSDFCITTGWLNPLLNYLGVFALLRRMITGEKIAGQESTLQKEGAV